MPQKGTTVKIATGDDRTQNVVALGTLMTVTATVGCKPTGDTTKRSCGRVYEVNNGTNTLTASLTIAAAGTYFFYSITDAACLHSQPACALAQRTWQVTVVVARSSATP